jgi:hypothetical protein
MSLLEKTNSSYSKKILLVLKDKNELGLKQSLENFEKLKKLYLNRQPTKQESDSVIHTIP